MTEHNPRSPEGPGGHSRRDFLRGSGIAAASAVLTAQATAVLDEAEAAEATAAPEIVSGDMLREQIVEVDTRVERWTERHEEETKVGETTRSGVLYSPAVCLGQFVLYGWSALEA